MANPTLTEALIAHIRTKPVTDADLQAAAGFVLDTLAGALAAQRTAPAQAIAAFTSYDTPDAGRRAFHFGGLAHILELDDLHRGSVTHPACVVIPPAAALAEETGATGRKFLTALLHGYEACCRIGAAVGKAHYRVFHNTATCGPFGAAMAAATLLDLTDEEAAWALGNAGAQASGVWEFLSAGAMSKHLHTARAAESGVIAAKLAKSGFTGARTILEGEKGFFAAYCAGAEEPQAMLADLEAPWQLTLTSLKPWPCCRHTQPTIDAALSLHDEIAGRAIDRIEVGTYQAALDLCDRADVGDMTAAKFSLQHCVAAALIDGAIWTETFEAEARVRLSNIRQKALVSREDRADAAYPRDWGAHVVVTLEDGTRLEARCTACKGDPENPLSAAEIEHKARLLLTAGGLTEIDSDRLIDKVRALPRASTVGDLFHSALSVATTKAEALPRAARG